MSIPVACDRVKTHVFMDDSIALCGETCPRSAKASRGEDVDIEEPVTCWDCSPLHFYPTLPGVLGASLIRHQVVEMR
jgi:hypothetical protein